MNQVQLIIVGVIAVTVVSIISYYLYQEKKFKKMVDNNFNQSTDDALKQNSGVVFENQASSNMTSFETSERNYEFQQVETKSKDSQIDSEPMLDLPTNDILSGSTVDASDERFAKFDQVQFPYQSKVSQNFDYVVDVYFPKVVKIKALPEVRQYVNKMSSYFILDKNSGWCLFEAGKKYQAEGIKLIINIVDADGVASNLQLTNAYNELNTFVQKQNGFIRSNDLELEIRKIQQQLKHLPEIKAELELFIVNKDPIEARQLDKFFTSSGLSNWNGIYSLKSENSSVFEIHDENDKPLSEGNNYRVLMIVSKLHHQDNPQAALDKIFDFAENYMQYFESRLLTSNRIIMTDKEFTMLDKHIKNYVSTCQRKGITLGSELIQRVLP